MPNKTDRGDNARDILPGLGHAELVLHVFADGRHVPFDRAVVDAGAGARRSSDDVHHGARVGRAGKVESLAGAQLPHNHL